MTAHNLKTHPGPFDSLWRYIKHYEVRKNDRSFEFGDKLILREFIPERNKYTGRVVTAYINCITAEGTYGLPDDVCVLGIRIIDRFTGQEDPDPKEPEKP